MKVTYLDNSGFVITLKDAILVFDYYRDPSHALNKILGDKPDAPVVFLSATAIPTIIIRASMRLPRTIAASM